MAHFNADKMTSGATQANHTGLNIGIANFAFSETGSGSTTVALMPLPAGARVIDITYMQASDDALGTGAEAVTIAAEIGGNVAATYISTATQGRVVRAEENGLGVRLTGSANLILTFTGLVNTGTASTNIQVIAQYTAQDDGD